MNHKFFRDPRYLCWWCNKERVEVISVTFVPRGGWCVFFKEKGESYDTRRKRLGTP